MERLFATVVALGFAGCGDTNDTPVDAAPGIDAARPDAAPDSPPAVKEGQVFIAEAHTPTHASIVVAMLIDGALLGPGASADNCISVSSMPATSLPAGSITVTGTSAPVTLAQDQAGDVYLPTAMTPAELFSAGDTLMVTTTGATVPAFSGSVTAPTELGTVAFPSSLSRSAPATMTWTAGSGDYVMTVVAPAMAAQDAILCQGPDTGSFTFTPAALALLSTSITQVRFITYRVEETTTTAGAWKVFVRAADGATSDAIPIGS